LDDYFSEDRAGAPSLLGDADAGPRQQLCLVTPSALAFGQAGLRCGRFRPGGVPEIMAGACPAHRSSTAVSDPDKKPPHRLVRRLV